MVDICHSGQQVKFTTFTDSNVNNNNCFSKYHTSEKNSTKNYFICSNKEDKGGETDRGRDRPKA